MMSQWMNLRIAFECAPESAPRMRQRKTMTLQVYGDSESAILAALRKAWPGYVDFVLLDVQS